ncbi:MAG: ABC transporter substrate-binding protein [Chloroflexi bacterium]|nr:ABC transporter substrate-binding protein [Chloroflexota bacterium]
MSRKVALILALVVIVAMMLTACATPAPPTESTAGGGEKVVTIGFTASQTGKYNVESSRQSNGLKLWMDDVNNAGGIKLSDGTVLKFASKFYDDESNKDRVQELYTRLATEDNADFLISPYSSGLTAAAAVIAEQYGKVMITTGAASDATYKQGYTLVYQAYTPASRYLTSSVDLLASVDASAKKIAFVYENSKFSTAVVEAAKAYAEQQGFEIVLFEGYDPDTRDFNPFINKIQAAGPDAILGGGHFQDGSTFARQLNEKNLPIKFISLLVAPPEPTFAELGDAAVGVAGPSQWEAAAKYSEEAAKAAGMDWLGISSADFAKKFEETYGEPPSYHAAGGYAAGLLLQNAIQKADSLETAKVKAALDATNLMTFFGPLKFDTSAEAHGLQIGHGMIVIQWQRDDAGNLVKQVVWPTAGATAEPLYPIR